MTVDYNDPVRVRYDWDRDMLYPAVEKLKYSEIRYPTYGAVVDDKGEVKPMSAIRLASNMREGGRVLGEAAAECAGVAAERVGDRGPETGQPDLAVRPPTRRERTKYIILFDRTTKLPVAVRTRDEDNIWGDSNYDMMLSDWKTVNGVKIAY